MAFVVDASMTMAWHFPDEETPATLAVLARTDEEALVVPSHWFAEVANSLVFGERKRRAGIPQSADFIRQLNEMTVEVEATDRETMFAQVLPLARAHGLTIYDAIYLELSERRGLPLATLDGPLADAARAVGVEVWGKTV